VHRREFLAGSIVIFAAPLAAEAQRVAKIPRVGFLSTLSAGVDSADMRGGFLQGLQDLGYVEDRNIVIEWRFADGKVDRLADFAADLVHQSIDVIVCTHDPVVHAVKRVTTTIPIVMVVSLDPIRQGYIASLARPGANITGLTWDSEFEIVGKYFELLREAVPNLSRVAGLIDAGYPGLEPYRKVSEEIAPKLGLTLRHVEWRAASELQPAFETIAEHRAQAVFVYGSALTSAQLPQIIALATKAKLPTMFVFPQAVALGGLMSYGPSRGDLSRRSARYVDRILKGAKPADLPVERPITFEFRVNLKTAKALGLTIPQSLLLRADQIIE